MSGSVAEPRELVRADVGEAHRTVAVGEAAVFEFEVTNLDRVIRAFRFGVLGVDAEYVDVSPPVLELFPDERRSVVVTVQLPPDHPAGDRTLALEIVEPREGAPAPAVTDFTITVASMPGLAVSTEPATLEMGGKGIFLLHPVNTGNTTLDLGFLAQDPERLTTVTFEPERAELQPGQRGVVTASVKGPRPWLGMPVVRVLEIEVTGEGVLAAQVVALVQRPKISRRLVTLLGLLAVITLFAYVIWLSFERVANITQANEELVQQGLGLDDVAAARVAPASVAGAVTSSTGSGIDGAAVRLYAQDDLLRPVKATVTDEQGAFRFGAVADGTYLVQTEAAGFGVVWFPAALTLDDAEPVEVADAAPVTGVDLVLTGRPGGISGTVLGADVEGALVVVQLPATTVIDSDLPAVPSVVQQAPVDATGRFALGDLTTPATYEVVVSKDGFATETFTISLSAGEQRDDIEILLRRGIGLLAGRVTDTGGVPLGGVVVEGTDGTTTSTTRSLSGADTAGTFELRDLTTPGTYTLTFTAPGYLEETTTLVLGDQEQRDDIFVVMSSAEGSMSGTVRSTGGQPLGGVTVTVVGADVTRTTESLSVGALGTWLIDALPVPGTYTVTFTGVGFTTAALSVELVPGPDARRAGVDAVLTAATASVGGVVTSSSGVPIGGVSISLDSGTLTRQTVSSNDPPGAYLFDGLPPGVYTLTYQRAGSTPQTLLVDLAAGEARQLGNVVLEQRARITGVVTREGVPTAGLGVVVHRIADYPEGIVARTVTGPGGVFDIVGLEAPGTYTIDFEVPADGPVVRSIVVFLRPDQVVELAVDL